MLFDLVDTLQKKRRLLFVAGFIAIDFWLLIFCNQTLQAHRSNITSRIHTSENSPALPYQDTIFNVDGISASLEHNFNAIEVGVLRATVAATDGITKAQRRLQTASKSTVHTAAAAASAAASATTNATGRTVIFTGKVIVFPFAAIAHGTGFAFSHAAGAVSAVAHKPLNSFIKPEQNVAVPVITEQQIQQASLIQSGTHEVKLVKPTGSGGACDNGAGNGGYPMAWCNAPMDSTRTVSYSADHINRECTSYAYWYFTKVEGHADFRVTGNANQWAYSANFPTHTTPKVGAIAVETGGYYGHVAIVQALPGQTFDGKVVPAGNVLVSEMNYDWYGHFRYSYSPLSKFSAYIYR